MCSQSNEDSEILDEIKALAWNEFTALTLSEWILGLRAERDAAREASVAWADNVHSRMRTIDRYKEYFLKIITASGGDTSGIDNPDQITFPPIEELALSEVETLYTAYITSLDSTWGCLCGDVFTKPQDFVDHWEWCHQDDYVNL